VSGVAVRDHAYTCGVNRIPPVVKYTVLRLLAFIVPLALLLLLTPLQGWVSAVVAAIVGLCVSYIFLRTPRDTVATELYERRHGEKPVPHADEDSEDAVLDGAASAAPASPASPAVAGDAGLSGSGTDAGSGADAGRVEERQAAASSASPAVAFDSGSGTDAGRVEERKAEDHTER
jgi:hypothetical protein